MDNQNNPSSNQEITSPEPSMPLPATQPIKKPHNLLKIGGISVVFLILIILIPVAYIMGSESAETGVDNSVETNTSSAISDKAEEVEKAEADSPEEFDAYAGWNTYESSVYGYSFKYPADWVVERTVLDDPADWVSVSPAEEAAANTPDIFSIYTYMDGVGCPERKSRDFEVAGYTVKGTACVDTEVYTLSMKHSKTVGQGSGGVVLARAATDAVGIQVDMSRGEDEAVQLILGSITGLTPAN